MTSPDDTFITVASLIVVIVALMICVIAKPKHAADGPAVVPVSCGAEPAAGRIMIGAR